MENGVPEKIIGKKPDIEAIRREVEKIKAAYGGKVQFEEWWNQNQGGLRLLMTWRYQ